MGLEFMGPWYGIEYSTEDLKGLNDDDYISKPFCRDIAYTEGINYDSFETDL